MTRSMLFLALVLAGCAAPDREGYVKLKWHKSDNPYQDARRLRLNVGPEDMEMTGFHTFDGEVHHVFAPDNANLCTLGHEVKHAFDGSFHGRPLILQGKR